MRRFQMYLTEEQSRELAKRAKRDHSSVAGLVREAVDEYLKAPPGDQEFQKVLDETFGSMPDLEVPPRSEWDRYDTKLNRIRR